MAVEKSYARLGLFLVLVLVVVLATAMFFIYRLRTRAVLPAVTYTTENVSGLDVSSPVRYRGVSVGRVAERSCGPEYGQRRNRLRGVPGPPRQSWRGRQADQGERRHGRVRKTSGPEWWPTP